MACSSKYKGAYMPSQAAIKVIERRRVLISLNDGKEAYRTICKSCRECVRYCPPGEDLKHVLADFVKKVRRKLGDSVHDPEKVAYHVAIERRER